MTVKTTLPRLVDKKPWTEQRQESESASFQHHARVSCAKPYADRLRHFRSSSAPACPKKTVCCCYLIDTPLLLVLGAWNPPTGIDSQAGYSTAVPVVTQKTQYDCLGKEKALDRSQEICGWYYYCYGVASSVGTEQYEEDNIVTRRSQY